MAGKKKAPNGRTLRSRFWFDNPGDPGMTALYFERYLNFGFTKAVLTTGCDKTTPAAIMAAATVNIPAIVLSGGPMLNGWWKGERAGSGTIKWASAKLLAAGKIDFAEYMDSVAAAAPSIGHCNSMG